MSHTSGGVLDGRAAWIECLTLFILTFLIYLFTLAPGVYGFDSAELATGVYTQGIIHPPGFPLYLILGKLFSFLPVRDLAYRLNLMSAFFASMTVVLLFVVLKEIVESRFTAWIAAFLLAVSNYFWQMALVAEVYTVFTTLIVLDLFWVCLWRKTGAKKYLLIFSFFYGLTFTIHTSAILFAPAFTWLILSASGWKKPCWKWVTPMFILYLGGLLLYAYLSFRSGAVPLLDYSHLYAKADLSTLQGLWWYISGRAYAFFAFGYSWAEIPGEIIRFLSFLWRNYLGFGVLIGLVGLVDLARKNFSFTLGIFLIFCANAFFYVNYRVMDKDTMFLPAYIVWAVFVAAGLSALAGWVSRLAKSSSYRIWIDRSVYGVQVLLVLLAIGLNWRWVDMSHSTSYASFAETMLVNAAPDSVILAPWSSAVVIEYFQIVEGMRPDVTLINQTRLEVAKYAAFWDQGLTHEQIMARLHSEEVLVVEQLLQDHQVYAVGYDPHLAKIFIYMPNGPAYSLLAP